MCNCVKNQKQLSISVRKAKGLENKNKTPYGVYSLVNPKTKEEHLFVVDVKTIEKNKSVCCYYDSEGKKVTIKREDNSKKPRKKNDKKLQGSNS